MVWNIIGKHVEFEISKNGEFFLHGNAEKHFCRPSAEFQTGLDTLKKFRCSWEIHDGESYFGHAENIISSKKAIGKIAGSLINEADNFLSDVKNGKSVSSIDYSNLNNENTIIFCMYFSKKTFITIFDLLKFLSNSDKYQYIFTLDFMGFASNLYSEDFSFISYDRWISGSPYYTNFIRLNLNDYSDFLQNH